MNYNEFDGVVAEIDGIEYVFRYRRHYAMFPYPHVSEDLTGYPTDGSEPLLCVVSPNYLDIGILVYLEILSTYPINLS